MVHRISGRQLACRRGLFVIVSWLSAAAGVADTTVASSPLGPGKRVLMPQDFERLRPIWFAELSPDGRHFVMTIGRTPSIRSLYQSNETDTALQRDLWIAPIEGARVVNVTQGDRDASTSWRPVWSPSGKRLAALTTKGATDGLRLLTWTVGAQRSVLVPRVLVHARTEAKHADSGENEPFVWLNDDELLYIGVAPGHDLTTVDAAPAAWRRTAVGREVSSSVLESGAARTSHQRQWSTLQRLHVPSGKTTMLAVVPPEHQRLTTTGLVVSPDRRFVAVVGDIGPNVVPPNVAVSGDNERRTRLAIVPLDGSAASQSLVTWTPGVAGARAASIRWSADSSQLAVLGKALTDADASADPDAPSETVYVVAARGDVKAIAGVELKASSVDWLSSDRLLVRAKETKSDSSGKAAAREEWWNVELTSNARKSLTPAPNVAPSSLVRLGDGRFVGLADGKWVALGPEGAQTLQMIDAPQDLRAITWPRRGGEAPQNMLVAQSGAQGNRADARWYEIRIEGQNVRARELARPSDDVRFAGVHASASGSTTALFLGATESGTFAWTVEAGEPPRVAFVNNEFIEQIETGPKRLIEYRDADGKALKAALLLPPGYQEGTRVPVVVWMYGGTVVTDFKLIEGKHSPSIYNPQLFAAKGLAVLLPSIPLTAASSTAEPMVETAKAVLPAVDKLIELGIADSERIVAAGLSYGGYNVYGLLTQTSRFRAGIALSGDSDLFTSYAAFDGSRRYLDGVSEIGEGVYWAEASQGRMGVPPWRDPLRYLRNSPFLALDRIDAPLLMIHSDLDYVPIGHAERMFVGLNRLGKTARFVRYFGEKHGPYSAANRRDAWSHIYRFIDELVMPPRNGAPSAGK